MQSDTEITFEAKPSILARLTSRPERLVGFAAGVFVPLIIWGVMWAQTSGGLAGPLVDVRPQAFIVATE